MLNLLSLSGLDSTSLPGNKRGPAPEDEALNAPEEEGHGTFVM
jgi:hypothetical protein